LGRGNVKVSIQSAFDNTGVRKAETSLDHLNTHAKRSFGEATKHALGYGAALVGGAGIVGGLEAVAHASIEAGKAQAALDAQLKAVGISYKGHQKEIDGVLEKTSRLTGFMDKDLEGALGNIVRSTGNLGQSFKLLGLATDIARTKHIAVADAGQLVGKIFAGNTRVLKSLGLSLDPVTKAQDKLKESTKHASDEQKRAAVAEDKRATAQKAIALLQQKLGGQAEAYGKTTAGSLDKMKAAVDRLEIRIGNALAPTVKKVADAVGKFVDQMESGKGAGGRFARTMDNLWKSIKPVLGVVVDTAKWLGKHPALLKAAGLAWVAYKTAALTQLALVKAAELGLFGASTSRRVETSAGASGARAGRAFRLAFVAGATYLLYQELSGPFNKALESLTGQINATDPTNGRAQQQADARTKRLYGNLPNQGNIPRLGPVSPKYLPKVPKKVRVSSASTSSVDVMARASGEAGGQELGSLQRAQAWVKANFPGVGTLLEDAGSSNQHLHIETDKGTVVQIGKALQRAGFSVGENPAFGGVHNVHSHGGLAGIPGDHYTGNAIDVNADNRSLGVPTGKGGGSSTSTTQPKWRECVLTWYDPALGGINTGGGKKDPFHPTASGEAYNPRAYTCAAPQSYAFGTIIVFAYGGRAVACKVNDRGGAITGHHFDLSRAAAASLGIMGAGKANGLFMLPGKSKSIKKAKTPYDKLQNQLGYLGLEVEAGVLTQRQGDNAIIRAVNKALPNLTGSNKLRAMGEQASSAAGSPQPSEAAEAGQAAVDRRSTTRGSRQDTAPAGSDGRRAARPDRRARQHRQRPRPVLTKGTPSTTGTDAIAQARRPALPEPDRDSSRVGESGSRRSRATTRPRPTSHSPG
jgi:rare lipoprotein A (peptidoglycan hydrolase)